MSVLRLMVLGALGVAAGALGKEPQGFGEVRVSIFPGASGDKWQIVERVRPTLDMAFTERLKITATIEADLVQGRNTTRELDRVLRAGGLGPLLDQTTWPQDVNRLLSIQSSSAYLDVDRLYLDWYTGPVDLRVGRQALTWGSARYFNPTDPFPEVLFAEPWRPRRGVNAVRAIAPFGGRHDATAIVAVDDTLKHVRAAGKLRFNYAQTDFAAVGAYRGDTDNGLVGVDLRGTFYLGWWVEAAYVLGPHHHEEIAVGVDYSFAVLERLDFFVQYYRNGGGLADTRGNGQIAELVNLTNPGCCAGGLLAIDPTRRTPFLPYTLGRDYVMLGGTLMIIPELTVVISVLQNVGDGTGIAVPTITYNVFGWLDFSLSAQVPYSLTPLGGEFKPLPSDLRFTGDLGPPVGTVTVDLSGLYPAATITFWARASF